MVKAVDLPPQPRSTTSRKRKPANSSANNSANANVSLGGFDGALSPNKIQALAATSQPDKIMDIGSAKNGGGTVSTSGSSPTPNKDTLMPKETCPVCGIQITYKNLARHIKLRHKMK